MFQHGQHVARLKTMVEAALLEETFEELFVEDPHNGVHVTMGCNMMVRETAACNTLFYLHHTYVDYVDA